MATATRSPGESVGRNQSAAREPSIGEEPNIENELVEIVRALARAAALEDHRKAFEANAMAATEAGRG